MLPTPIYADTVRATGIVPEGCPEFAGVLEGTVVLELPGLRPGLVVHGITARNAASLGVALQRRRPAVIVEATALPSRYPLILPAVQ